MSDSESGQCAAIVVAGGMGVRMGAGLPKALMPIAGRPLAAWCLEALTHSDRISRLILVVPAGYESQCVDVLGCAPGDVVTGGTTRAESVACGLNALGDGHALVLVHDAARPLLDPDLVCAVIDGVGAASGAIAAAPLTDTPKRVGSDHRITETLGRDDLWGAQTPQVFDRVILQAAIDAAIAEGRLDRATDCASLVEQAGGHVVVVPSLRPNVKVTTPGDVRLVELLLADPDRFVPVT
jgi:2-C-methyl-D-erythritol 4-phosphate cytidylyltransferase